MTSRTPREAARAFVEPIQRSLSCVTQEILRYAGGDYPRAAPHVLYVAQGDPVLLRGPSSLRLTFQMHYRLVEAEEERGAWRAYVAGYLYGFDDQDGHEVLAYHWHPEGRSREREPHLHLGAGAGVGRVELVGAHLPSGRISIEALLRLAITELDVEPRRPDWDTVLITGERAVRPADPYC